MEISPALIKLFRSTDAAPPALVSAIADHFLRQPPGKEDVLVAFLGRKDVSTEVAARFAEVRNVKVRAAWLARADTPPEVRTAAIRADKRVTVLRFLCSHEGFPADVYETLAAVVPGELLGLLLQNKSVPAQLCVDVVGRIALDPKVKDPESVVVKYLTARPDALMLAAATFAFLNIDKVAGWKSITAETVEEIIGRLAATVSEAAAEAPSKPGAGEPGTSQFSGLIFERAFIQSIRDLAEHDACKGWELRQKLVAVAASAVVAKVVSPQGVEALFALFGPDCGTNLTGPLASVMHGDSATVAALLRSGDITTEDLGPLAANPLFNVAYALEIAPHVTDVDVLTSSFETPGDVLAIINAAPELPSRQANFFLKANFKIDNGERERQTDVLFSVYAQCRPDVREWAGKVVVDMLRFTKDRTNVDTCLWTYLDRDNKNGQFYALASERIYELLGDDAALWAVFASLVASDPPVSVSELIEASRRAIA